MKKLVTFVIISLFFIPLSDVVSAHREKNGEFIADVHLERGKVEADVSFVRLGPAKIAAIVKIPIKDESKVNKIEIVSPCGKKYKAVSVEPMPSNKLKDYLDQQVSRKNIINIARMKVGEFIEPSAYASCGSCGGDGTTNDHKDSDRDHAESFTGFSALMGLAIAEKSQWFTVCIFEIPANIVHEAGEWTVKLKLDNQGGTERLKGKVPMDIGLGMDGNGSLTNDNLNATQDYLDGQGRMLGRQLTGTGIVSGLDGTQTSGSNVKVQEGMGVSSAGQTVSAVDANSSVSVPDDSFGRPNEDEIKDTNQGSFSPDPSDAKPAPQAGDNNIGRPDSVEARDTDAGSFH
jgi:hypothetical protein